MDMVGIVRGKRRMGVRAPPPSTPWMPSVRMGLWSGARWLRWSGCRVVVGGRAAHRVTSTSKLRRSLSSAHRTRRSSTAPRMDKLMAVTPLQLTVAAVLLLALVLSTFLSGSKAKAASGPRTVLFVGPLAAGKTALFSKVRHTRSTTLRREKLTRMECSCCMGMLLRPTRP